MNKKQRGFTTAELIVSGSIMLAITFTTFNVMITNVKLSAQSINDSSQETEQRTGVDLLQKDLLAADATMTQLPDADGKYDARGDERLILRQPVIDGSGNVVVGKKRFIVYQKQNSGGKNALVRLEGVQVNSQPFTMTQTDVAVPNVQEFKYRLARKTTIQPVSGAYPMPANLTTSEPSGAGMRLLTVNIPSLNISTSKDDSKEPSKRGLISSVLALLNIKITGSSMSVTTTTVTTPLDALFEIDEEYSPSSNNVTIANEAKIWITVKGRKGQSDVTVSAAGLMRNAQ